MNELRRNVVVGLFVLAGLGAMGVLIVLFGQDTSWGMPKGANLLDIRFETAPGIKPGTVVSVGGVDMGRVRSVEFVDRDHFEKGVSVIAQLEAGVRLRAGTRAQTVEPGMGMGRPPIELIPGPPEGPYLAGGAIIQGRMAKAVESLIPSTVVATFDKTATQLGDAAAALTPVLQDMHELLQSRDVAAVDRPGGPPGNLSSAMTRLDATLKHFNTVLGDPQTQSRLNESIANIHAMSEDGKALAASLRQAVEDARGVVNETRTLVAKGATTMDTVNESTEKVSRALLSNLEQISTILTEVEGIARAANAGEGSLGKFVRDERLYESMVLSFRRLADTVEEFKLLVKQWQEGKIRVAF